MDYKNKVRKWFKVYVQNMKTIDAEFKNILNRERHPNLERFFENMAEELIRVQRTRVKRGRKIATDEQLAWLVGQMAEVFVSGMHKEAKRRYETDIERAKREFEAAKIKEFDDTLDGRPSGEFAEAGVITNEKIDGEREESI